MLALTRWMAVLLLVLLQGVAAVAGQLRLVTEENAPFNFTHNGRPAGLYVDVVQEIQQRVGNSDRIFVYAWSRGYKMVQTEPNVALFATTRSKEREQLFQWVGPIGTSVTAFFSKRGAGMRINSLEDAKAVSRILVPRDWYTHDMLLKMGFTNVEAVDSPKTMVRMVLHARAPLMFSLRTGLQSLMAEAGGQMSDIEQVFVVAKDQGYIAFSAGTPQTIVEQWQQALDAMKKDGSFAAIYEKWLPGETPTGLLPDRDVWPNR